MIANRPQVFLRHSQQFYDLVLKYTVGKGCRTACVVLQDRDEKQVGGGLRDAPGLSRVYVPVALSSMR